MFFRAFWMLLFLSASTMAIADTYQDGLKAHKKGDHNTAHRIFSKLAEKGDPKAQFRLGYMFGNGEGVETDYAKAMRW